MTETIFIEACKKSDILKLKELSNGRKKLSSKSRVKEYENLFQRGLFEMLGSSKEKEIANILSQWCGDVSNLITEKQICKLLAKGKYEVIDELLKFGLDLSKESNDFRYKSVFDRLFKESIKCSRVDDILYLMSIFDIKNIEVDSIIKWLSSQEEVASYIDEKLKDRGHSTILEFLINKGVTMEQIIDILN